MDAPFIDTEEANPVELTPSTRGGTAATAAVSIDADSPLAEANRQILAAIETPPDTGVERDLDRVAATLWALEHELRADPGACCRLRQKLRRLERRVDDHRADHLERARRAVESYGRTLESV